MDESTTLDCNAEPCANQEVPDFDQVNFEAVLTAEQVREIEAMEKNVWGSRRRLAMTSLSSSKAQLLEVYGKGEDPNVLMDLIEHIDEWAKHLRNQAEIVELASARLIAVARTILHNTEQTSTEQEASHG
jgi:hypothetical protein